MKAYDPKEFWNLAAPQFSDPNQPNSEFGWRKVLTLEHDILFEWIDNLKPKNVLQIGIGFGREIKELLKRDYIESITGVDISSKMIEYTKKYIENNSKVTLFESDIVDLPFGNDTFDLVFTVACLTHVKDIDKALGQLIRVGKKNIIIVEIPIDSKNDDGRTGTYRSDIIDVPNHFFWDYEKRFTNKGLVILNKKYAFTYWNYILLLVTK